MNRHKSEPYDAVFLDIDMPGKSGFELAHEIRGGSEPTLIIFVSAKHELVYSSFEYTPFYFICKSNPEKLYSDLEHVTEKLFVQFRQSTKISITDMTKGNCQLTVRDILYIKSENHYIYYYVKSRSEPYRTRGIMTEAESLLIPYDFVRCHNRYLVNLANIESEYCLLNMVLLKDQIKIPVSKKYKDRLNINYQKYLRRQV